VYESLLDRLFRGTRFEVDAQRVHASFSAALLREAAPELAKVANRERVEAIFPVSVAYTRLLPTAIAWIPDLQHCFLPEFFFPTGQSGSGQELSRTSARSQPPRSAE